MNLSTRGDGRSSRRRLSLVPSLAFVIVPLLGMTVAMVPAQLTLPLLVMLVAVLPPTIWSWRRDERDLLTPDWLFAIGVTLLFAVRPAYRIVHNYLARGNLGYDTAQDLPMALWIAVVGTVAFYAGYYFLLWRKELGATPLDQQHLQATEDLSEAQARHQAKPWILLSLSMFTLLMATHGATVIRSLTQGRQAAGTGGITSGYLSTSPIWLAGVAMVFIIGAWRGWRTRGLGWVLFFYSIWTQIGPGSRSYLLPPALTLLIASRAHKKIRLNPVTGLLIAYALFALLITAPREFRGGTEASYVDVAARSITQPGDAVDSFLNGQDTAMAENLGIETQVVPASVDYQWGKTYLEALARPIPRFLWADKPRSADELLNSALFPQTARDHVGFSFSVFGEPYLNGGFVGVIVVMAAWGAVNGQVSHFRRSRRGELYPETIYYLHVPFILVFLRGGLGVDYQRELFVVVPVLAMYWVHNRNKKRV